jgi:hypothetical protein
MSVAVITIDDYESVRQLMCYLRVQTVRESIEIVLICPFEEKLAADEGQLAEFASWKVVALGPFETLHEPRVAAVRNASCNIVAFTEDHCFPAANWAENLIKAHEGPWAAVGPIVGIANPRLFIAWTSYFMQYGDWVSGSFENAGESDDVAGHNSSYKRDVLMEYGEDLDRIMVFESVLHEDLLDRGHRLYVEAGARSFHVFITRWRPFCVEHYFIGRLLASTRKQRWPGWRKLVYILGSPLIPVVRFYRVIKMIRQHGMTGRLLPGILPSLLLGLASSAAGELLGYALGAGHASEDTVDLDMNRWRYVTDREKEELWSGQLLQFSHDPPLPGQKATL